MDINNNNSEKVNFHLDDMLSRIYEVNVEENPLRRDKWKYIIIIIILSGLRLSPLGSAAITGLLYQLQMIDGGNCGVTDGMKIGRETEVLGDNMPQLHFVHHKSYMP
jgi:hypothetical protein